MNIKIISDSIKSNELFTLLENKTEGLTLKLQPRGIRLRGMDPTVLVAIIGTSGTALAGLINSILSVVKERQLGKIVIESKDGAKIEVPANYPSDKLDAILEKMKQLNSPQIIIAK